MSGDFFDKIPVEALPRFMAEENIPSFAQFIFRIQAYMWRRTYLRPLRAAMAHAQTCCAASST
jgi:hypothetical protein